MIVGAQRFEVDSQNEKEFINWQELAVVLNLCFGMEYDADQSLFVVMIWLGNKRSFSASSSQILAVEASPGGTCEIQFG